jgi:predicted dehydrogenase
MLEAERPDAVYLCLPPFAHGEPERALLDLGIPFFVEKPLGLDGELPEEVARRVDAAGLLTSAGYHWRYIDTVERSRQLLAAQPPRLALGYWLDFVPPPPWWTQRRYSGGQVVDQTTHILDLARHLVGEVAQVHCAACPGGLQRHPESDIEAASVASLRFESGAVGMIASTCLAHYPHRIGLWLYAQDLILGCQEHSLTIETPDGVETVQPQDDPFLLEDRAFIRALQTGDRSGIRVPYGEALRTHRLTMRVVESACSGRLQTLGPGGRARDSQTLGT